MMKQFFQELDVVKTSAQVSISPSIKESLDSVYSAKFPGIRSNWTAPETAANVPTPIIPLHQRTWMRAAAVGLLVIGTVTVWRLSQTHAVSEGPVQTAKLEKPEGNPRSGLKEEPRRTNPESGVETVLPESDKSHLITYRTVSEPQFTAEAADESPVAAIEESAGDVTAALDEVKPATYYWSAGKSAETEDQKLMIGSANSFGAVAPESAVLTTSFSAAGKNADLNPNGLNQLYDGITAENAISMADEPDDLMDLLVPAF